MLDETERYMYVVISLEIGFVLICAPIVWRIWEASGEFWGPECIAVLGRSVGEE